MLDNASIICFGKDWVSLPMGRGTPRYSAYVRTATGPEAFVGEIERALEERRCTCHVGPDRDAPMGAFDPPLSPQAGQPV